MQFKIIKLRNNYCLNIEPMADKFDLAVSQHHHISFYNHFNIIINQLMTTASNFHTLFLYIYIYNQVLSILFMIYNYEVEHFLSFWDIFYN
jgi:hypothetical protein